jgi:putative Mg2+ transporter-C (MgtC) family protein
LLGYDSGAVTQDSIDIAIRLAAALTAGSLIGLERSYHGRQAGFRTHALVCLASALLMLIPAYQVTWLGVPADTNLSTNPSRMAQGIMTGIGFLGAGVIFKQGFFTVRGLTTAASVWFTAALGILYGMGFYYPALLGTLAALGTLGVLRWLEWRLPRQSYARLRLSFAKGKVMREKDVRQLLGRAGFEIHQVDYRMGREGVFDYTMVVSAIDGVRMPNLANKLRTMPSLLEFRMSPTGD